MVSLDLDLVITASATEKFLKKVKGAFKIERFEHSLNLSTTRSDLRIQFQTDRRYQDFIPRASKKQVMGYEMKVAAIEDVLLGKVWAYQDKQRRGYAPEGFS